MTSVTKNAEAASARKEPVRLFQPNQPMKPTAPRRDNFSVFATNPPVAYLFLVRRIMSAHTIIPTFGPWFFMAWGVLLSLKPNIFVRGIWKHTDIAQRLLSPKAYLIYTRCVGIFFIAAGFIWLVLTSAGPRHHHSERPALSATVAVATSASNQSLEPTAGRCEVHI